MTDHNTTMAWIRVAKHIGVSPDSDPLPQLSGLKISELLLLQQQIQAQIHREIENVISGNG
jgi:hypothetical protein